MALPILSYTLYCKFEEAALCLGESLKVVEVRALPVQELLTSGHSHCSMADNRYIIITPIVTARHTRTSVSEGSLDGLLNKIKQMLKAVMERLAAEVRAPKYRNLLKDAGRVLQDTINKMGDIETQAQAGWRADFASMRLKPRDRLERLYGRTFNRKG